MKKLCKTKKFMTSFGSSLKPTPIYKYNSGYAFYHWLYKRLEFYHSLETRYSMYYTIHIEALERPKLCNDLYFHLDINTHKEALFVYKAIKKHSKKEYFNGIKKEVRKN